MISLFRVYLPRAQPLNEMNYRGCASLSRAGSAFFGWQGKTGAMAGTRRLGSIFNRTAPFLRPFVELAEEAGLARRICMNHKRSTEVPRLAATCGVRSWNNARQICRRAPFQCHVISAASDTYELLFGAASSISLARVFAQITPCGAWSVACGSRRCFSKVDRRW
jgi:hypothetical protein